MEHPTVLVLSALENACALEAALRSIGCASRRAADTARALEIAAHVDLDAILLDVEVTGPRTADSLRELQRLAPHATVLLIAPSGAVQALAPALREGASDLLLKPLRLEEAVFRVERALGRAPHPSVPRDGSDGLIGDSKPMRVLRQLIEKLAPTDATVLITGESGTGKDLVAHEIHQASPRAERPFVVVHGSTVPETLFESELFGHEAGAFTGSDQPTSGLLRAAHGGTLFLDEIGDLPGSSQAKFLRILQTGEVRPLGGTACRDIDVRAIAATNRDLRGLVAAGRFREDLYYRLHVLPLNVPPLRERGDDVAQLARHLLARTAARLNRPAPVVGKDALAALMTYTWPGNVRELENCLTGAALRCGPVLGAQDLAFEAERRALPPFRQAKEDVVRSFERDYVRRALDLAEGNISAAARLAGKDRKDFWTLMKKHRLSPRRADSPTPVDRGDEPLPVSC